MTAAFFAGGVTAPLYAHFLAMSHLPTRILGHYRWSTEPGQVLTTAANNERPAHIPLVAGSNPAGPTILSRKLTVEKVVRTIFLIRSDFVVSVDSLMEGHHCGDLCR